MVDPQLKKNQEKSSSGGEKLNLKNFFLLKLLAAILFGSDGAIGAKERTDYLIYSLYQIINKGITK